MSLRARGLAARRLVQVVAVDRGGISGFAAGAHVLAGRLLLAAKRRSGLLRSLRVQPYRGHGTAYEVHLKGRVHEQTGVRTAVRSDSAARNVVGIARRFLAAPIPSATVRVHLAGEDRETSTDAEGYFRLSLRPARPLEPGWHDVEVAVPRPIAPGQASVLATGQVLVPAADVEVGVISDLDDTVLRTGLTNLMTTMRVVLLNNARTRTPFPGVAALYDALRAGPSGVGTNPLFYVSSSPWNLYDFIEEFLAAHGIPAGPVFLRAWGFDADSLPGGGHEGHKSLVIRQLFDTYPQLSFVLIGDSGQRDPEIYRDVALSFPHRVRAVYIRDVTTVARDRQVHAIAAQVRAAGVEFLLVADTAAAARHAAGHGLIASPALDPVAG